MAISIFTVPAYLHIVGDARYGVLSLVWLFLGYFGLFDPGLSRAAIYHIARLHDGTARERGDVFWTAISINLGFGIAGGIVLYLVTEPLFLSVFKIPTGMRGEVLDSLPWLAASVPLSIVTAALTGVLQAREWFGVSNTINIVSATLTQIIPLYVAFKYGPNLSLLIPIIIVVRTLSALPAIIAVAISLPLGAGGRFRPSLLGSLFSYGGWITLSNLINPILSSIDRLLIGGVLNVQAVAFYTVPFNLVSRISVIPGALSTSLFPKLSRTIEADSSRLANDALISLAAATIPLTVAFILALPIFMRLWVGAYFASHSTPVGTILLIGIWINGLAYIPYGQLQASNRPDLIAKFHAAELLPFLAVLWFGVHFFGLIGAAWAWTIRVAFDAGILLSAARQLRECTKLFPGLAIVCVAPYIAPYDIISLRTALAIFIFFLAIGLSFNLSPLTGRMILRKLRQIRYGHFFP